jgi:hypothetical protein
MNIFGYSLDYSLPDVIISITLFVLSFVAFFYFAYFRDIRGLDKENYKVKDMLIEGYLHKFDEYNGIISDLQSKIDLIELKINPDKSAYMQDEIVASAGIVDDMSRNISHSVTPMMNNVIITNNKEDVDLRLNTVDSILKMVEVPLTSREIQRRIRKSREHTSRLLKKLYSENFVMRDESTRPFKYKITNEGRKQLERTRG